MQNKEISLGDKVIMKKNHACGSNLWEIVRVGADVKIKCLNCGHVVMMTRIDLYKKMKKKVDETNA